MNGFKTKGYAQSRYSKNIYINHSYLVSAIGMLQYLMSIYEFLGVISQLHGITRPLHTLNFISMQGIVKTERKIT